MTIVSTSTSAFFERARANMKDLRSQAENLQGQLSSQQRLSRSSDDPVAASRLRTLSRMETLSNVDTTNAERANADLSLADAALTDIAEAIIHARELATEAASETLTSDQRAAIGLEMEGVYDSLFALANSRDSNGHALFGGQSAGDAYTLDGSGNPVYSGTTSSDTLSLGEGQSVTRSLTGPEFLNFTVNSTSTDLLTEIKNLASALQGSVADPAGAAKDALDTLTTGLDTLTTAQTVVGTRLSWIELTSDRRTNLTELRSTEETEIGATDIPTTVATLQETMLVLEASQASFSKLSSLSLFNSLS